MEELLGREVSMSLDIKDIRKEGWKPLQSEQGLAWFGGKSHQQLSEWLPDEVLEDEDFEDIDFLVVGWRKG